MGTQDTLEESDGHDHDWILGQIVVLGATVALKTAAGLRHSASQKAILICPIAEWTFVIRTQYFSAGTLHDMCFFYAARISIKFNSQNIYKKAFYVASIISNRCS